MLVKSAAGAFRRLFDEIGTVDQVGVEERVAKYTTRSIKKASKVWGLKRAVSMLDLTTLEPVRQRVVVPHPLQPFDVRNVKPGSLGVPTPFTFDPTLLSAAEAAVRPRPRRPVFLAEPLAPAAAPAVVSLDELVAFFKVPV